VIFMVDSFVNKINNRNHPKDSNVSNNSNETQKLAQRYGLTGLIPFVAAALLVWVLPEKTGLLISGFFIYYSAVILSFFSGILWCIGLQVISPTDDNHEDEDDSRLNQHKKYFTISIVFTLLAWLSILIPLTGGLLLLGTGFIVIRQFEKKYLTSIYPEWFTQMRDLLTRVVFATHLSLFVFVLQI
jgi:hypothetical protein